MPCEVVLLRFDFFKMAAVAIETAKIREIERTKMCGRIIVKKKRRIAIRHPTVVGVTSG
jgi:hypothetical protein